MRRRSRHRVLGDFIGYLPPHRGRVVRVHFNVGNCSRFARGRITSALKVSRSCVSHLRGQVVGGLGGRVRGTM